MTEKEVAEDYRTALCDLDNNSRPLITMLTMLADENQHYAAVIVDEVRKHIETTPHKLPAMYLIDSIVKNVGKEYKRLFGNIIANLFCKVFKEVDEKTKKKLHELRQTWNDVFPTSRLYMLDFKVNEIDPGWVLPLQPKLGSQTAGRNIIYVNPTKFSPQSIRPSVSASPVPSKITSAASSSQDLEELKKLQNEKRILEEERKKVEKLMKEKDKSGEALDKIQPLVPKPNLIPNRQSFLKDYKIKKKAQTIADNTNPISTDKKIMPNIYVAPWKAKEMLPKMTGSSVSPSQSKDSRVSSSLPRDPRIPHDKVSRRSATKEIPKDPRLLSHRDQQPKVHISSNQAHYTLMDHQPAVSLGKWVSGKSESTGQVGISSLQNVVSNTRPSLSEPKKPCDITIATEIKKPVETKKLERVKNKHNKEKEISYKAAKKDAEHRTSCSPLKNNKKEIDEKLAREKELKDERDKQKNDVESKSKVERDKKDKDERDVKVKEEREKEEKDKKCKDERDKKVQDDSEKKFQNDWCKRVKEEREKLKDDNNKRIKEDRDKKDKSEKEKKEKEEKDTKIKDDRNIKDKDIREKKEKGERDKKEKDDKDKKDKDDREKKDKDDKDKKDKDERDKKDIDDRNKKDIDERLKKDVDDRIKRDIDEREKKEKINRDKEDNDKKEKVEKEKLERLELERVREEIDRKEREIKGKKVKEDNEKAMKEELEKKEVEENLRKEERRKTEKLLKERYEEVLRESENEIKIKLEEERKSMLEKNSKVPKPVDLQLSDEKCDKNKDESDKKHLTKSKSKEKGKIKSGSGTFAKEFRNNLTKEGKVNLNKSHEKPSKTSGHHINKTNIKKKDASSTTIEQISEDKFKAQTNNSSRRREHIRPRDKTPDNGENSSSSNVPNIVSKNLVSSSGNITSTGESKKSKSDKDGESDDSDHYDANKPQPSIYASKKASIEEDELSISKEEPFMDVAGVDTDLRLLTSQTKSSATSNDTGEPSSSQLGDLFGTCDTDLRQLPPAAISVFPHNQVSSKPSGIPPGVVLGNPFISKPDQDLRDTMMPGIVREGQENKDVRFNRGIEGKVFSNTLEDEKASMDSDIPSKKHCFSSPHAAKWEKFREKNPEFKEYQRQASLSEKLEMYLGKDGSALPLDLDRPPSRSGGRGFGRRGRGNELRHFNFSGHSQDWFLENQELKTEENYQFMINQLNEQFKNGDIPDIAYMRMMEDIRIRIEKDKIREVQEKERGGGPLEERWIPGMKKVEKEGPEVLVKSFKDKSRNVDSERFLDGKWQPIKQGGERQSLVTRAPGPSGNYPKMEDEWTGEPDLPALSEDILRTVNRESETRKIEIDGAPREIRTYGEKAIVLMDWNDPRTLEFEAMTCDVIFDEGKFTLTMSTRDDYRNLQIDRENHRIKLGVPTMELMIDGKGYQCFFGGKPISVYLAGKDRTIRLSGKPPKVDIGTSKNMDYLVGKVELIINAKKVVHLFLDAKPQRFNIDGMPFVIKFIDSFKAVAINGVKFPITFGGLPISISVRGFKRFLRFSALPATVIPGKTSVKGMDTDGTTLIPAYRSSPPPNRGGPSFPSTFIPPGQIAPLNRPTICNPMANFSAPVRGLVGPSFNQVPPLAPPPFPILLPPPQPPHLGPPQISHRMSHPPGSGVIPGSYLTTGTPQSLPNMTSVSVNMSMPPPIPSGSFSSQSVSSVAPPVVDVQSLLNSLVKTGLIGTNKKDEVKDSKEKGKKEVKTKEKQNVEEEEEENIDDLKDLPPLEAMFNLDNLRKQNVKLITKMYRGMQCSSCGLRYPPDQTAQYSHHLDWHFRMNKKQQESTKKVNTRKFYLCIDDWLQYEEIEDIEERVPSMFEMEGEADSKNTIEKDEDAEEEVPSVSASSNDPCLGVCPICHETFTQFYHENTEEWHYKNAIQVDGINYHPACHLDLLKSQKNLEEKLKKEKEEEEEKLKNEEEKLKKDEEEVRLKKEEEVKLKNQQEEENLTKVQEEEMTINEDKEGLCNKGVEDNEEKVENEVEELENINKDDDIVEEKVEKAAKIEILLDEEEANEETSISAEKTDAEKVDKSSDQKQLSSEKTLMKVTNGFGNIKIKDEPMDGEDGLGLTVELVPRIPPLLADIPIKMEIPDDDGRYEDDVVQTFEIEDEDEGCDDADENEESTENDSWTAQTTTADIAISIDGNTELLSQPEVSQPSSSTPKIKISVSKPSLANNVESIENAKNVSPEKNSIKIPSFLEEFSDVFEPPPFTVDLKVKPAFEGVELIDQPVAHRGFEISSLCSIM